MRQTVRKRRAIEEHEFVLAVVAGRVAFNGLLEGVVLVPVVENGLLHVGEAGVRRDVRGLAALVRLGIYVFAHRKSPSCTVHWSYRSVIDGDCRAPTCAGWVHECHVPNRGADCVNRLAAGTDCVPPGTARFAVPAYEDDDGAGMRSAPRYHLAYRTGCAAPNCCTRSREPARPLVFGCLGPIPSVLLGDCRRSSEDSPLITDHCLTTVHIVTRHAVKSMGMFIRNVHSFSFFVFIACTIVSKHARLLYRRYCTSGSGAAPVWAGERIIEE